MDWVRKKLYADAVHQAGITGKGVTVAVLDSGISRHPDYAKRIIVFKDFINGRQDYLVKPFHFDKLEARIRSLLPRRFVQDNVLLACGRDGGD